MGQPRYTDERVVHEPLLLMFALCPALKFQWYYFITHMSLIAMSHRKRECELVRDVPLVAVGLPLSAKEENSQPRDHKRQQK